MEIEIVDEAGNVHGPFATVDKAITTAADRGLGEQRDDHDDERAGGWCFRRPQAE